MKKNKATLKDTNLNIRAATADKDKWERKALLEGLSTSVWIRAVLNAAAHLPLSAIKRMRRHAK